MGGQHMPAHYMHNLQGVQTSCSHAAEYQMNVKGSTFDP
jgi:hypothetical protein